jgi:sugar lactone lactonase YvrE
MNKRIELYRLFAFIIIVISVMGLAPFNAPLLPQGAPMVFTLSGSGVQGYLDGAPTVAKFSGAGSVATDDTSNVYVADYNNNRIRKITPAGTVTTIAGTGVIGFADGPGINARFNSPAGIATDSYGYIYVADQGNNRIRKISPSGLVSTLAGNGIGGTVNGPGRFAEFNGPTGIAVDTSGAVYVTDYNSGRIRKITAAQGVTTLSAQVSAPTCIGVDLSGNIYVGSDATHTIYKITRAGVLSTFAGNGSAGYAEGTGAAVQFNRPEGISVDLYGNVYVADENNNRIRKITPAGVVSTLAGSGVAGAANGAGGAAQFHTPVGVAADQVGNLYVMDYNNFQVRRITLQPTVTTFAGSGVGGYLDGTGVAAKFWQPAGSSMSASGNLYIADQSNQRIRMITPAGVTSTIAGNGTQGLIEGAALSAEFLNPAGVALDKTGNIIYVADFQNHRIRKITGGTVSTFAGSTQGFAEGSGTAAKFSFPTSLVTDSSGNVFVADYVNNRVRKITPAGAVSTFAGTGVAGNVNGPGAQAKFDHPVGIAIDAAGNLYVAENATHRIRKITKSGIVSNFAGSGVAGSADGIGTLATFNSPSGLVVDSVGMLYVADRANNLVRKITPRGRVTTMAGVIAGGYLDGVGLTAKFTNPNAISIDASGVLYIMDQNNHRIRKIQ